MTDTSSDGGAEFAAVEKLSRAILDVIPNHVPSEVAAYALTMALTTVISAGAEEPERAAKAICEQISAVVALHD
jgi:hypothetical protein